MKPDAWAALKATQRANKKARPMISNRTDQLLVAAGREPRYGTMSRKPARKAREKGK